ncbi:DUF6498-containing protein [Lacibacter sediminis]|uniref:Uncharacterized protein n=1 Tax=Lacibacter sediminis TaxID=2760713 RepID=A0A7G5XJ92_9BACT|nr:DUF6498-containing protein [Lacibacter sediminis]QNA45545.1 hypothetical protein H4075_04905 [Lacibacter sediminis]
MLQRIVKDPGFWFLLLMNGYLIYYYQQQPGEFNTIIWIYWLQSVLIGLFNFFDLMSVKNPDSTSMSLNSQPVTKGSMGCAAWFFLLHYGFFHFVYAIFLLVGKHSGVNGKLLLITAGIFVIESTIQFIRKRNSLQLEKVNVGKMFFTPYLRIVPMHLMILVPSFLGITASVLFLVLKTVADAGMYLLTTQKDFTLIKSLSR